jgi:hypothetical protein
LINIGFTGSGLSVIIGGSAAGALVSAGGGFVAAGMFGFVTGAFLVAAG